MIITILTSAFTALLIGALAVCAGIGILHLSGVRKGSDRLLLAPTVFLATWSLFLVVPVLAGIALGKVSFISWALILGAAALGIRSLARDHSWRSDYAAWLAITFATLLVLSGFLSNGLFDYLGSPNQDGMTYVALADYIREYPRGTEGGLSPSYQFASHLSASRFVGCAMLATMIPPGVNWFDTQMAVGPLFVLGIVAFAGATTYANRQLADRGVVTSDVAVVLFAVIAGWFALSLFANNFDNLIVLATGPALYAVGSTRKLDETPRIIVATLLIAAAFYMFPELSVLFAGAFFAGGFERVRDNGVRRQLILWTIVLVMVLILATPHLDQTYEFFKGQLTATKDPNGPRPGNGMFPDMLVDGRLPGAVWGYTLENFKFPHAATLINVTGVALLFAFAVGVVSVFRARLWGPLVLIFGSALLFAYMLFFKRYDYGAYKILLQAWWLIAILVCVGVNVLVSRRSWAPRVIGFVLGGFVILALGLSVYQQFHVRSGYVHKDIRPIRAVRDELMRYGQPVTVNVTDATLNGWLMFLLRNYPIRLEQLNGYLAQSHVIPVMKRSKVPDAPSAFTLVGGSDLGSGKPIWANDLFRLVRNDPSGSVLTVGAIEAPNGVEKLDGATFFWLDKRPAHMEIQSTNKATARLKLVLMGGTSVADLAKPLEVSVSMKGAEINRINLKSGQEHSVDLPLDPGSNDVTFAARYDGPTASNPNGDTRTLLAGIKVIAVEGVAIQGTPSP